MKFVAIHGILEYPPVDVRLGVVVLLDEVGLGSTWILDLLVAIVEGVEGHAPIVVEGVCAVYPEHDTSDAVWVRSCTGG